MKEQKIRSGGTRLSSRLMRGCGGCLVIASIAVIAFYGLYFILRGPLPKAPQLIAHRGGPLYAPENTVAAFRHAIDVGVDWLEFDVQRTRDGVLIVFHDEMVDRTTNGSGNVVDLTWEQFQALDAGNGEKVPTFEEVIILAKNARVKIMPEAKSPHLYPGLEVQMVAAIENAGYIDKTVVQSFDADALDRLNGANPELAKCALYGLWQFNLAGPQPGEAAFVCPMAEMVLLNPWMIREAHQEAREVYVWFGIVESPLVMRILLAMGADGLIVDDPVTLAEILGR